MRKKDRLQKDQREDNPIKQYEHHRHQADPRFKEGCEPQGNLGQEAKDSQGCEWLQG